MGYSRTAITKGVIGEKLAEIYFLQKEYTVLKPETHETNYDFAILKDGEYKRVQVKTNVNYSGLIRFRNKHGANNSSYKIGDYDLLCGVDIDNLVIYLFLSEEINKEGSGETISVARLDGKPLSKHKRFYPYIIENIF